jgi:dipeptidyl aminopeptidase/acylaminoacyl peptidase
VTFEAADGLRIHGQLFVPRGLSSGARAPAVIFMHGGPMRQMLLGWHPRGYYARAYAFNQYLASRGFVVLSVNYRLGVGYGRAFREAERGGRRGASEYQDIVAAGRFLQSLPEVDGARIGLWGGSYGGYLTALGMARDPDLFKAGVDVHGVHDWNARFSSFAPASLSAREADSVLAVGRASSPVCCVTAIRGPILFIHGDDDRNVAFSETVNLVQMMRREGKPFELLVFPDEVHDFLRHASWLAAYRASADFLDRTLVRGEAVGMR